MFTTTRVRDNLLAQSSSIAMMNTEDLEAELRRAQHESAELRAENASLRRENTQLRARLDGPRVEGRLAFQLQLPVQPVAEPVTSSSSDAEKIGLFRKLFRGREDVYAVRWASTASRAGYSPACRSRSDRERGIFLPLTDQALRSHLNGRQTIGVYPLLGDETCWFLAADFDKEHWHVDVTAYLAACDLLGVPAALERSRSGNGAHVWVFFDAAVPAFQARKLGCILLTLAIEQRHQIGLDSYDRLFPNQDTLPKGGFGNLIALPLQHGPRLEGNSVFIDPGLQPYADQWAFLSAVRRMSPMELDALVAAGIRAGSVIAVRPSVTDARGAEDPWTLLPSGKTSEARTAGPFPMSVRITIANLVYVTKAGLPPAMISRLWRLAAFQNPEFYRAQALRLSTFGKPRVISCAEEFDRYIGLPRGCLEDVQQLLTDHGIDPEIVDGHNDGKAIDVAFRGELTPAQRHAADGMLAHDTGVLCAPTAFGKTIVAAWLIAARHVNTLVLVHRRHLLDQWRERLATVLELPPQAIGQIGAGRHKPTGSIDVAVIQSLVHDGIVNDLIEQYGHVIVDECHHIPAFTFERVLKAAKARFVLGLTATPIRKDGHHPIVIMQCGPLRFRVSKQDEAAARPFAQFVFPRPTGFRLPDGREDISIQELYATLAASNERNDLICADLLDVLQQGRTPLLLTERTGHLAELARRLEGQVRHLVVLQGGMGVRQRRVTMEQLSAIPEGEP